MWWAELTGGASSLLCQHCWSFSPSPGLLGLNAAGAEGQSMPRRRQTPLEICHVSLGPSQPHSAPPLLQPHILPRALQQPCCPTGPVPHAQATLRCIYLRYWEMGMEPCCWQSWVQGQLCPQTSHEQLGEQTPSVGWWGSTSSSPFCLGYKCFAE